MAEAVKRESESLLYYLFVKKQDLGIASTMALHCSYVSLVQVLRETVPADMLRPLLEILRERDGRTLYDIDSFIKKDGKVGIA
jgi:hypothetical protein